MSHEPNEKKAPLHAHVAWETQTPTWSSLSFQKKKKKQKKNSHQ